MQKMIEKYQDEKGELYCGWFGNKIYTNLGTI